MIILEILVQRTDHTSLLWLALSYNIMGIPYSTIFSVTNTCKIHRFAPSSFLLTAPISFWFLFCLHHQLIFSLPDHCAFFVFQLNLFCRFR